MYCSFHRQEGMVDVKSNRCIHEGCRKIPTFNIEGERPMYCGTHRTEGMIDVKHDSCIHDGCGKHQVFNIEGERPMYCGTHRKEGMIDVKSNRCIYEGCKTRPYFNKEGQTKGLYCGTHRKEGMVDVKNNRCIHEGCKTRPTFNTKGETKGLYCGTHRKEGMIDVKNDRCKTHLCSTHVNEKYDGYCFYCYMHLFPDKPVYRNYKTKEYSVVEYVKTNYSHPWIADKITGGCSRRRPDLLLDLMDQVLIIEIDENQHLEYDCSCENKRIMELSQDLAHRPIVFIRFNPDDYQKSDTKVTSCWGQNQKGICVVKKSKKVEWEQRLSTLGETIEYWLNHRTDKTVEIIQLFYDSIQY
jgi:nitrite reductase/ring-hydroxylating ferredoxin subunit